MTVLGRRRRAVVFFAVFLAISALGLVFLRITDITNSIPIRVRLIGAGGVGAVVYVAAHPIAIAVVVGI